MLENTIEQTDLITPADAIELSMDDLENVNGAWGGDFGSCFGFGFFPFVTAINFFAQTTVAFSAFTAFGSCF